MHITPVQHPVCTGVRQTTFAEAGVDGVAGGEVLVTAALGLAATGDDGRIGVLRSSSYAT